MGNSNLHTEFREDLIYWVTTIRKTALKFLKMVEEIIRNPFEGIGKPDSLRFLGKGAVKKNHARTSISICC